MSRLAMPLSIWIAEVAACALTVLFLCGDASAAQSGKASWYSHTSVTASGERCDPNLFTAAHRSLPFGTMVLVENLSNGRTVVVRINDRGPFVRSRIIDVTKAAAQQLGWHCHGNGWRVLPSRVGEGMTVVSYSRTSSRR